MMAIKGISIEIKYVFSSKGDKRIIMMAFHKKKNDGN